jgi:hypothetical protein
MALNDSISHQTAMLDQKRPMSEYSPCLAHMGLREFFAFEIGLKLYDVSRSVQSLCGHKVSRRPVGNVGFITWVAQREQLAKGVLDFAIL